MDVCVSLGVVFIMSLLRTQSTHFSIALTHNKGPLSWVVP